MDIFFNKKDEHRCTQPNRPDFCNSFSVLPHTDLRKTNLGVK